MARKKVKLAWIANDSTRRATFKKRKKGLLKKAQELSTLCDVKTCVVVYGPQEREPEAWPSTADCQRLLQRFRSMPETEQSKKMVDQEGFLMSRLAKTTDQLHRLDLENCELETCLLIHDAISGNRDINGATINEAANVALMLEMRMRSVQDRIRHLRSSADPSPSGSLSLQLPGPGVSSPSASQSLNQPGFMLSPPVVQPPQTVQQAPPNPGPAVQADVNNGPMLSNWYNNNSAGSFGYGRSNELIGMQQYLGSRSAWNSYLPQN